MAMDTRSPPVFRYNSYSPENTTSTSTTSRSGSTENPTVAAVASTLASLSDKLSSTKKRQRALSEEFGHVRKRHIPSTPYVGALISTKGNDSAPASQTTRSTAQRDSGFHEDAEDTQETEVQDKRATEPSSQLDDSGFHDAVSDIEPDDDHPETIPSIERSEGLGQTAVLAITAADEAPRATEGTQTDDEFHDALDQDEGDALTTTSEMSIVVSSARNDTSERTIVVSPARHNEEHAIHVKHSKKARGHGGDRDGARDPKHRASVGHRNDALDNLQPSIVVSGPSHGQEQVIHVQSPKAARSGGHADPNQDDKEYVVLRVASHRLTAGADVELLVYWESPHDDGPTWELEENLQANALDAVVDYWATVFGERLSVRPYEVFAVTGHEWLRKGKAKAQCLHLEVEWLGYKERTMEPWRRFAEDQPELVEEYFESIGGRPRKP
ncbi:hypothetical protein CONLIGDRAFT_715660 [Coniochaeta ligniaria NRRL 30616]|uniref:Chromo domain-containing protein n=1 Tax=Coniochaeta ligniaria NRRL 30616 TaxID=1408157 RepID=A0A1J7J7P0_9PEZI|nr:hypothetical protein CONLIGDRAFT_715660 [Coniochaeta ligniaria NRRL 30616]